MKLFNTTVIALALAAAATTSAFARDGIPTPQGGTAAYYPNAQVEQEAPARFVAPTAHLTDAEQAIIGQNANEPGGN